MRTDTQTITRLAEYRPSDYLLDTVELDIRLHPTATEVVATLALRPNPAGLAGAPLCLDGDELVLRGLELDGSPMAADAVAATPDGLTIARPPAHPFVLTIRTEVNPSANTKLMGLYRSGGIYCTQCEADGFRRITYALDRPDVLARYTTRIEADREDAPVLLGNGNLVGTGAVPGTGRHYAVWHNPFTKPPYLFAIVAGRLDRLGRTFTTMSGRPVEIAIYVEPGKVDRAPYALDALERSMRWDERVFGREYDLEVFNVVAVSDFNMGAMENKGLNVFNDKYVLASPDLATDGDYAAIEAIIAHEYFHNWTGNRITCRDWFQLCLKEGLTVFRDQEFSSDERSRAVQRIGQVRALKARQFTEDGGPLAHPVRPTEYREINNFYTATVYEKGAEVVRMLKTLLGEGDFSRGMARYFERFDGTAATVEDFLSAFAEVSGRDLAHFARWYAQSGTPTVAVATSHDEAARTFRIDFAQATPPTPGQAEKGPLVIPVALGLVGQDGAEIPLRGDRVDRGVFVLDRAADSLLLHDVPSRAVPSLFRGFSAPVKVAGDLSDGDLATLIRHDSDPFTRWQSVQTLAMRRLLALVRGKGADGRREGELVSALAALLEIEAGRDPAYAALTLALPGEGELAQEIGRDVDPDAVHRARETLRARLGSGLAGQLSALRQEGLPDAPFSPDAAHAGRRSLRNTALDLLAAGDPATGERLAQAQFERAGNMTDRTAALSVLGTLPGAAREDALGAFGKRYAGEPLVLDKWFSLQASIAEPETLDRVRRLMNHPAFSLGDPNRVRALVGSFALSNPTQFHRADGAGYAALADVVLELNGANPQLAARLLTAFSSWRMMEAGRRAQAEQALLRIAGSTGLSPDVADIVRRSLAEG